MAKTKTEPMTLGSMLQCAGLYTDDIVEPTSSRFSPSVTGFACAVPDGGAKAQLIFFTHAFGHVVISTGVIKMPQKFLIDCYPKACELVMKQVCVV